LVGNLNNQDAAEHPRRAGGLPPPLTPALGCLRWKIKHLTVLWTTIANPAVLGLQGLQTLLLRWVIFTLADRYVA
jgi:hypothetical protein